uniref:(northern house mosquito) hypothetical protein n=2 Tax=Culex pipiens TaxID=7175 RepID=A0A8D8KI30_CULPI
MIAVVVETGLLSKLFHTACDQYFALARVLDHPEPDQFLQLLGRNLNHSGLRMKWWDVRRAPLDVADSGLLFVELNKHSAVVPSLVRSHRGVEFAAYLGSTFVAVSTGDDDLAGAAGSNELCRSLPGCSREESGIENITLLFYFLNFICSSQHPTFRYPEGPFTTVCRLDTSSWPD